MSEPQKPTDADMMVDIAKYLFRWTYEIDVIINRARYAEERLKRIAEELDGVVGNLQSGYTHHHLPNEKIRKIHRLATGEE